jgi:uncharacterized protein (TIGR02186 family)
VNAWKCALVTQLALGFGLCSVPAHADPAIGLDLSHNQVRITTGFAGGKEFLFGTAAQATDIIVRVNSMNGSADLSRKERVGPFWLNGGGFHLTNVPRLLYLLSNRPLADIASRDELKRYGLTFRSNLAPIPTDVHFNPGSGLRAVFVRIKENNGSYRKISGDVRIHRGTLFSASIPLPAGAPTGTYEVNMFAFRDGKMIGQQSKSFLVREVGLERWVSKTAVHDPGTFGVLVTLLAVMLGLCVSVSLQPRYPQAAIVMAGARAASQSSTHAMTVPASGRSRLIGLLLAVFPSRLARSVRSCCAVLFGAASLADGFAAVGLAEGGDIDGAMQLMEESRRKNS